MPINNTMIGRNFKNARKITKRGTIKSIGDVIEKRLNELMVLSKEELIKLKEKKYLEIG